MNSVGKISYLNAAPFFTEWPSHKFPLISAPPRQLAQLARLNKIIAGPLPVVEGWALSQTVQPLMSWGIAVKEMSQSVLVLSKKPFSELNGVSIGVTVESSTSVALLEILIRKRYSHQLALHRGFRPDDQARLIIGDDALMYSFLGPYPDWPYLTDLATEWWEWKKLPFVFAQWVVRNDISPDLHSQLVYHTAQSLQKGVNSLSRIAKDASGKLDIASEKLTQYLEGFIFELGPVEKESMAHFQTLFNDINISEPVGV